MQVLRVHITGWTASFRNPLFISGFQPTLPVPPLSTVYGLLSAARGDWVTPADAPVGFVFHSQGKAVDLETVYEFESGLKAKPNVCKREFLISPELYLYTPALWLKPHFEQPHYPLLIGRSTELATVVSITSLELKAASETEYQGTLLPFPMEQIYGQIQALPTHFTPERPRRPQGIRPVYLLTQPVPYVGQAMVDSEMGWGVYVHGRLHPHPDPLPSRERHMVLPSYGSS
jgi:CRISPR-associated protein Cas5t